MNEQNDDRVTISPAYGVDVNGVPLKQDQDTSTDYQARAQELEQLLLACLGYIKELSDYNWRSAPRTIALQDRAAALGIVLEVKP